MNTKETCEKQSCVEGMLSYDCLYFSFANFLKNKGLLLSLTICLGMGFTLFILGYIAADIGAKDNFLCKGINSFYDSIKDILVTNEKPLLDVPNLLAFLYVVASITFFILNFYSLPRLFMEGRDILITISEIYDKKPREKLINAVKKELDSSKTRKIFIFLAAIIFLAGELWVIYKIHKDNAGWTIYFIIYLITIPVFLNSILVGTQCHLAKSTIAIVKTSMPELPLRLYYDEDGVGGLQKAGDFILKISFKWFCSMLIISPLFYMSGSAGILMLLFLAVVGFSVLSIPQLAFRRLLANRKRAIMKGLASELNELIERYRKEPTEELAVRINLLRETYNQVSKLRTWLFKSVLSTIFQILPLFESIIVYLLRKI